MLFGQIILYLITNVPFACFVLYGYVTESTSLINMSVERIVIETFVSTLVASFILYWFNGVRFSFLENFSQMYNLLILVVIFCLYFNGSKFPS